MRIVATAAMFVLLATAASAETVYISPRLQNDRALFDKLGYDLVIDNSAEGLIFWWRNIVERDGTGTRIYFRSNHLAPGYSVCFRWEVVDSAGKWRPRHFCEAWYDRKLHSREILSAGEAARIKSFTVENFDVEGGASGWSGVGRPPGALAHQRTWYRFAEPLTGGNTVYGDPQVVQGNPLYEKLLYSVIADAAGEPKLEWARTRISRDRGEIRVYFQSKHRVPDYAVCFWWRFVDTNGEWQPRHFCADWMDQQLHSRQILSASEADRIRVFHLHNFDIRRSGLGWTGRGQPDGMIAHQYTAYTLTDRPAPLIAETAPPPSSDDAALWAIGKCALLYLGEAACKQEVEQHLGRSLGGLSCAAFLQQAFGGQIDPGELAIGALADIAVDSKSEFWQLLGGVTKAGLFMKCVDDNQ